MLCYCLSTVGADNAVVDSADRTEPRSHGDTPVKAGPQPKASDVNLTALQNAVYRVNDGPPSLPSICLYALANTHQGYGSQFLLYCLNEGYCQTYGENFDKSQPILRMLSLLERVLNLIETLNSNFTGTLNTLPHYLVP